MGRHARIALLLTASSCLLAVMIDWVVEELNKDQPDRSPRNDSPASEETVEPEEASQPVRVT